jgi:hypothetical protein
LNATQAPAGTIATVAAVFQFNQFITETAAAHVIRCPDHNRPCFLSSRESACDGVDLAA